MARARAHPELAGGDDRRGAAHAVAAEHDVANLGARLPEVLHRPQRVQNERRLRAGDGGGAQAAG
jgi:hypothetical protein